MPSNQINPFDYNIDKFDSGFLGPITGTNLRTFLFTHNLTTINPVIGGILGGSAWDDRGTEYNVSEGIPKVTDVPNLTEVANTPSLYNNLTNPREVNLSRNIMDVNPEVLAAGFTKDDLGVDVTSLFVPNSSNIDLPSLEDVSQVPGTLNNFTNPLQDNLDKNPTALELATWHPDYSFIFENESDTYKTSYGLPQTLKLGFAGSVESWVNEGGYTTTTHEIRDLKMFAPENNKYGPATIVAYNDPDTQPIDTGFIQYHDSVQGDFRDQIFSRTLGVGVVPFSQVSSGINYKPDGTNPSELDLVARKRRGIELANRLKLNFIDDTVGAINTSPFGLLAGGNLIDRDYTITVPKSGGGKATQFLANLAGFNLPTSIIPDDAFPQATGQQIDVPNSLLDYTGSGQKSLLFDALYINKFGPTLGDAYSTPTSGQVKKSLAGAGQPPNTRNYLSEPQQPPTEPRDKSLVDTLNDKVDSLFNAQQAPSIPTESENPTVAEDQYGGFYGTSEQFEAVGRSFSEKSGFGAGNETEIHDFSKPRTTYLGTPTELLKQGAVTDESVDWRKRSRNPFKKGILKYTQDLINKSKLGDAAGYVGYFDSAESLKSDEYKQDIDKHGHLTGAKDPTSKPTRLSKGNTTRNYEFGDNVDSDTGGEFYCRSWSSRRKYHTWDNLIRSEGNWWRVEKDWSNLMTMNWGHDPVGMPKIAWDSYDSELYSFHQDVINANPGAGISQLMIPYMFSIENLAWKDAPQLTQLPPCEKGPNGGRIMWFPPYNIDFSDNTSTSWDATNFIGRGEPIYTYNHTERTGQLSFTIVVDHPSALNELKNRFKDTILDEGYNSFFAGCDAGSIKNLFKDYIPSNTVISPPITPETSTQFQPVTPKDPKEPPFNDLKIYFENCRTSLPPYQSPNGIGRAVDLTEYEVTLAAIAGSEGGTPICVPGTGLNEGLEQRLNELAQFLVTEDGKNYKITILGYTSSANPTATFNTVLGNDRANNTKNLLYNLMVAAEGGTPPKLSGSDETYPAETALLNDFDNRWDVRGKGNTSAAVRKCSPSKTCGDDCCDGDPCDTTLEEPQANSKTAKGDRYSLIQLVPKKNLQANILNKINNQNKATFEAEQKKEAQQKQDAAEQAAKYYINECDYFMEMKRSDSFIYNSLGDKIKNFHPAFHAITPEGFNSRITFLQQCMRQGPQLMDSNLPQNMVFGRPPVCVLKIGDFYHTKIIIDSCNFTFDPLQWDLNPEGIGVQPMLVKVDLGFKFIGGSSLGGPIKQLQNAVSYNFFANTGVYRPAQVLENVLEGRQKFIYGAFITPGEADSKFAETQQTIVEQKIESVTNPVTSDAPIDGGTLAEIEVVASNDTPPSTDGGTSGSNQPPTSATVSPSKGGTMVYNQDGSVNITDINDTFSDDTLDKQPSVQIVNKTDSPLVITKITGESNLSGVRGDDTKTVEPNGVFQFNLIPELTPGSTQDSTLRVTSTKGEHQLKMILKPQ